MPRRLVLSRQVNGNLGIRSVTETCATIVGVIVEFMNDDDGYISWLSAHPDGFVLNCGRPPTPSYLMLHRSTCGTISRASGTNWTVLPEGLRRHVRGNRRLGKQIWNAVALRILRAQVTRLRSWKVTKLAP